MIARTSSLVQRVSSRRWLVMLPSGISSMKLMSNWLARAYSTRLRISSSLRPFCTTQFSDPLETGFARRLDAVQHLLQAIATGEGGEAFALQRVEADVEAADAGGLQLGGALAQLRTVGGDRQVFQFRTLPQACQQAGDALAHQRLAAGDTNAPHAEADEGVGHRVKFLQAEDLVAGKELHVFAHAVGAAEVAAIRHRQAQVGDATAEGSTRRESDIVTRSVPGLARRSVGECERATRYPNEYSKYRKMYRQMNRRVRISRASASLAPCLRGAPGGCYHPRLPAAVAAMKNKD